MTTNQKGIAHMSFDSGRGRRAFVVRVAPGGQSMLDRCLKNNEVVIGWDGAGGLVDEHDWQAFRTIVSNGHYAGEQNLRRAGAAAGHLWRFIREMGIGDWVVVPAPDGKFYVAEVQGDPKEIASEGVGYSRMVEWQHRGLPIERRIASARLQSRMKIHGSTASATDLIRDINSVVADANSLLDRRRIVPTFESDLRAELVGATLAQMREGRVDSFKFEQIVRTVLLGLGATNASITSRRLDEGDDIVADFNAVGGMVEIKVCVQVKHYNQLDRQLGPTVVDEVLAGMSKVGADLGIIATAGTVSQEAVKKVETLADEGLQIVILDGEQLATLYLDYCVGLQRRGA